MKVAYLVNQYPFLSHSFVRREIRGLEVGGTVTVARYSMRDVRGASVDPDDAVEAAQTHALLGQGASRLLTDTLRVALRRPVRVARSAALAARLGLRSDRGLVRHAAYLAEEIGRASCRERVSECV